MGTIANLLKRRKARKQGITIPVNSIADFLDDNGMAELTVKEYAIQCTVALIANAMSECTFRVIKEGKEDYGPEWFAWNYEPNQNQNASQFIQEMVSTLLRKSECLIVEAAGQRIIAESFTKEEYAVKETVFRNITRKGFSFQREYAASEVIYLTYQNENVKRLIGNLCKEYQELMTSAADTFRKAGGERGTIKIDAAAIGQTIGGKEYEEIIEDLMNNRFKKYFNSKNAVLPLFHGYEYSKNTSTESKKSTSDVKDITDLEKEIIKIVAAAFQVPYQMVMGELADIDKITKNFIAFCIRPLCMQLEKEITRKLYDAGSVGKGRYIQIDTSSISLDNVFDLAEKIDKLIASGLFNIDELRVKLREPAINEDWSRKHHMTKNYEEVAAMKGGDTE